MLTKYLALLLLLLTALPLSAQVAVFEAGRPGCTLRICENPAPENRWDGNYILENTPEGAYVRPLAARDYLYFSLEPELRRAAGSEPWLVIECESESFGMLNLRYVSSADRWQKAAAVRLSPYLGRDHICLPLPDAAFDGSENGGADFRLEAPSLHVYSVQVHREKPAGYPDAYGEERLGQILASFEGLPRSRAGEGMMYVLGDSIYDLVVPPSERWTIPFGHNSDPSTEAMHRSFGATSLESYVTWELCEPEARDRWEWDNWDRQVANLQERGLKLTPFLILGPAYSVPAWFRETEDHAGCVCLEHGAESKIESLWNPRLMPWVDRFLSAFAARYNDPAKLETVLLGIQGDYGEAIYPVTGGWTQIIPGEYHSHNGFWCGDPYALADYRAWLRERFGSPQVLDRRWGTSFGDFDKVDFPARGEEVGRYMQALPKADKYVKRQYLDFMEWYRGSMGRLADEWMGIAEKYFDRDIPIYLCTGGNMEPQHGSDFSLQCKIAAKHRGGVRITNEGSEYKWNNCLVRLIDTACRFYGAKFGHEPATDVTPDGLTARIYGAASSGADQLHEYARNVFSTAERTAIHRKNIGFLERYPEPVVPVALFYPLTGMTLDIAREWGRFTNFSARLRDVTDHDFVDERLIRDGALKKYRVLVLQGGDMAEPEDALKMRRFAEAGGRVIIVGDDPIEDPAGTGESRRLLLEGRCGSGSIVRARDLYETRRLIREYLEKDYPIYDLADDQVFGAQPDKNTLLFHNASGESREARYIWKGRERSVVMEPHSIKKVGL
ncbi:MAG: family 14 glycosylhydrolase [Abditibacteriota bacterium]|nr:family 14 glycosylhydrolase [Abditibacteriota bacterium]